MSAVRAQLPRVVVLLALLLVPLVLNEFRVGLLTEILIFGLAAASLDLLVGYTGLPSLGHAAFFGVGGYAAALAALELTDNALAVLVVGVLAATLLAAVTGALAVRTRGTYFLMLTLAFAQLLWSLAISWDTVTGGANGLRGIPRTVLWPGLEITTTLGFYYYALAAAAVAYLLLRRVVASPFGRTLVGIRENEARMRSVGYPVNRYKLVAFCIAGAVGGYGGALLVQMQRFVSPANVAFQISALVLIMVIMGGIGTLWGPVLGAGLVLVIRDDFSTRFEHWELALGLVFVAFVYFLPRGIGGTGRALLRGRPWRLSRPAEPVA